MDKNKKRETIAELLVSGKYKLERDGWTQCKPEYFTDEGFPNEFIEPLVKTFKSDGTWKGSLWKNDSGIIVLGEMQSAIRTKQRGGANRILAYYQGLLTKRNIIEVRKQPD